MKVYKDITTGEFNALLNERATNIRNTIIDPSGITTDTKFAEKLSICLALEQFSNIRVIDNSTDPATVILAIR